MGGEDFDQRLMQHFAKLIKSKHKVDITGNQRSLAKLNREVEKAKRALSTHSVKVEIESLIDGEDFSETLTRAKFEELNADLFKRTLKPVEQGARRLAACHLPPIDALARWLCGARPVVASSCI